MLREYSRNVIGVGVLCVLREYSCNVIGVGVLCAT